MFNTKEFIEAHSKGLSAVAVSIFSAVMGLVVYDCGKNDGFIDGYNSCVDEVNGLLKKNIQETTDEMK